MFYGLSHGGTPGALTMHMDDHDVPIKNWSGNTVDGLSRSRSGARWPGTAWPSTPPRSYACVGCPIACGSILTVEEGKYPVRDVHKPEYETLAAFGPMCLNDDMRSLIYVERAVQPQRAGHHLGRGHRGLCHRVLRERRAHQGGHRRPGAHLGQ